MNREVGTAVLVFVALALALLGFWQAFGRSTGSLHPESYGLNDYTSPNASLPSTLNALLPAHTAVTTVAQPVPKASSATHRPKPVAAPPTTVKSSGTTTCHVDPVATSSSGVELSTSSTPPRFNKIHSLCYGKAKKSCGVVVNAATSDIAHSHFLLLAALSRISAWQESFPSIADLPAAILTTAHLSSDPFTVQRAAAHNITLVAVAQQSMDPSATSTLAHPSHVYALSPYEFTVLVNASYNFFPRAATGGSGTHGTNRYPPAVASLHLLEFFDVLAPPLPRWDEPSVSDAMHAARVAAYGEAADGVRITTQLHHPAVLLYRIGPGTRDFMHRWGEAHRGGYCKAAFTAAMPRFSRIVARHALDACSLALAAETSSVRLRTVAPFYCADRRLAPEGDLCTYERTLDKVLLDIPSAACDDEPQV
jgi:hypothetical protein